MQSTGRQEPLETPYGTTDDTYGFDSGHRDIPAKYYQQYNKCLLAVGDFHKHSTEFSVVYKIHDSQQVFAGVWFRKYFVRNGIFGMSSFERLSEICLYFLQCLMRESLRIYFIVLKIYCSIFWPNSFVIIKQCWRLVEHLCFVLFSHWWRFLISSGTLRANDDEGAYELHNYWKWGLQYYKFKYLYVVLGFLLRFYT